MRNNMSKFNCFILLAICLLKLAGSSVLEKRSVDSGTRIDHCKAASKRADLRIANIIEELDEVRRELDSIRNGMCGQKCEGDWTEFQNSCYLYRTESANWTQAEEICKSIGGNLVKVDSSEEQQFLVDLVLEGGGRTRHVWIGAYETDNGQWKWIGSGDPVDYTSWSAGEPNSSKERCAQFYYTRGHDWNDNNCSRGYSFICEKAF